MLLLIHLLRSPLFFSIPLFRLRISNGGIPYVAIHFPAITNERDRKMLQRAASNAYSWWWASHIRTKQSKWLEQNLQDMEEKVEAMLKLIQEDGDSFAKRAEMYYKRRPELINFVEESFKAYRSIAERYDKMSTELQNANNTLATVFPERMQFAMDEDDDDRSQATDKIPRTPKKSSNIPRVPNLPKDKDLKGLFTSATKKIQAKKGLKSALPDGSRVVKSGLTKPQAIEEVDKLQKGVLALQTEKEYVKSAYDLGLAKYWELEKIIREKHDRIYSLQDEFNIGQIIEDDEARNIMVTTALRSCDETLASLQDIQAKASEEAKIEQGRIKNAQKKFSLKNDDSETAENMTEEGEEEQEIGTEEKKQLESLRGKIKMYFEEGSKATLTVTEMAENIDELVNKVIVLETAVLSQNALLKRLRTETDELESQISSFEDDKKTLISSPGDMSSKVRVMGGKLDEIQGPTQNLDDQNDNLETNFTQAHCSLAQLTEKLDSMNTSEELESSVLPDIEDKSLAVHQPCKESIDERVDGSVDELESQGESKRESNSPAVNMETVDGSLDELKSPKESIEDNNSLTEPVVGSEIVDRSLEELKLREESKDQNSSAGPVLHSETVDRDLDESQKASNDDRTSSSPAVHIEKVAGAVDCRGNQEDKCAQAIDDDDPYRLFQTSKNHNMQDKNKKQDSSQKHSAEDEPNWRQLFVNGLENREKTLLTAYTTMLRNLKDVKKQLGEVEKKSQDSLTEMKHANGAKDEEIRSLRQKLSFLETTLDDNPGLKERKESYHHPTLNGNKDGEQIKVIQVDQPSSAIEQKLRTKIDEVLEENLDFWLNFSSSFHQIQKFQTGVEDLQAEISKLEGKLKKKQDGSIVKDTSLKSDAKPIYKHLQEIEAELTLWLEQSVQLKDESQTRFKALCTIEEEISNALTTGCEPRDQEAGIFTSYQAGKFQGEVLNMKQENSKVAEELQSGLDLAATLQLDIQKTLAKLDEDFELSGTNKNSSSNQEATLKHSTSRSRIPLRSFIFGVKPKKQRLSIFSSIHPVLHRKLNDYSSHHRSGHAS